MKTNKPLKINGTEISKLKTAQIVGYMKTYGACVPFYFLFGAFFLVVGVAFLIHLPVPEMWIVPVMGIVGGVVFLVVGVNLSRKVKAMNQTLVSRSVSAEDRALIQKSIKKIVIAGILAMILIPAGILAFMGGSGSDKGGSKASVTCPNCGTGYRADHPAADYILSHGHCSSCNGR